MGWFFHPTGGNLFFNKFPPVWFSHWWYPPKASNETCKTAWKRIRRKTYRYLIDVVSDDRTLMSWKRSGVYNLGNKFVGKLNCTKLLQNCTNLIKISDILKLDRIFFQMPPTPFMWLKPLRNKAGYTSGQSRTVGQGLWCKNRSKFRNICYVPTDTPRCRVACPRLKMHIAELNV